MADLVVTGPDGACAALGERPFIELGFGAGGPLADGPSGMGRFFIAVPVGLQVSETTPGHHFLPWLADRNTYRYSNRDSHADSDCHAVAHAHRHSHSDRNSDQHAQQYPDGYANCNSNDHADANRHGDQLPDLNIHLNADEYGYLHRHAASYGHPY